MADALFSIEAIFPRRALASPLSSGLGCMINYTALFNSGRLLRRKRSTLSSATGGIAVSLMAAIS